MYNLYKGNVDNIYFKKIVFDDFWLSFKCNVLKFLRYRNI